MSGISPSSLFPPPFHNKLTKYRKFPFVSDTYKLAAISKLRSTSLKYTLFITGVFMDYLGPPTYISTHLMTINILLDSEAGIAAIPGTGDVKAVFTHTATVAAFVAASLDLNPWPEKAFIIGESITGNELLAIAESIQSKLFPSFPSPELPYGGSSLLSGTKFEVHHDSISDLAEGKVTELPVNIPRYQFLPKAVVDSISSVVGHAIATGWFEFPEEDSLNKLLPEVKVVGVKEFLGGAQK